MVGKKYIAVLMLGILVISSVTFSGCVEEPEDTEETLLRMGFAWSTEIDPATGTDFSSTSAFTNFYDPLVFPRSDGTMEPWIAEDWEVSEDEMTWTFYIRDDVEFHSGNQLTAEDVMFSMERLVTMGEGFAYLFGDYIDIEESQAIDDYTVEFVLEQSRGPFLSSLARLYIVDKEVVLDNAVEDGDFVYEPWGNDLGRDYLVENSAGSGPYEVYEAVVEDHFYGERFEDYWGPMAENSPDEFRMLALGEAATERTMFQNHELEVTSQWLDYITATDIADDHDGKFGSYPEGGALYGMMNTQKEPLDCVHVREALSYAYDYQSQIDDIFQASELMNGVVPISLGGGLEQEMPRQDLDRAQSALEESEYYPEIVDNPEDFEIEASWTGAVPATEHAVSLLASSAEEIGLTVQSRRYEWAALIDAMATQETSPHISTIWVTPHFGEAGSLLESRYHSRNSASWEQNEWLMNDTIDDLIDAALREPDTEERFALYEELQENLLEMYPSLFMHTQHTYHTFQQYIEWPHAENPDEEAIPAMGYNVDARRIEVLPPGER